MQPLILLFRSVLIQVTSKCYSCSLYPKTWLITKLHTICRSIALCGIPVTIQNLARLQMPQLLFVYLMHTLARISELLQALLYYAPPLSVLVRIQNPQHKLNCLQKLLLQSPAGCQPTKYHRHQSTTY